jgi:release factor glutamine methyltransferase
MSTGSDRTWTVLELLRWTTDHFAGRGIETARLDAECLLAHALRTDRLRLYLEYDKPVDAAERARFRELVRRRADARIPVAQLTGKKEFWSLPLCITPDVLIPRPETETLVAAVLDRLPVAEVELRVLDIGTGSGALALALASERPKARVVASDVSDAALAVARVNAEALGLTNRVRLVKGDVYEPVAGERFDLIVSNPPYLAESEAASLAPELAHEPRRALFAGPEGTEVLRALVAGGPDHLAEGGVLGLEIAAGQAEAATRMCREANFGDVRVHRDLAGLARAVTAIRAGDG